MAGWLDKLERIGDRLHALIREMDSLTRELPEGQQEWQSFVVRLDELDEDINDFLEDMPGE